MQVERNVPVLGVEVEEWARRVCVYQCSDVTFRGPPHTDVLGMTLPLGGVLGGVGPCPSTRS